MIYLSNFNNYLPHDLITYTTPQKLDLSTSPPSKMHIKVFTRGDANNANNEMIEKVARTANDHSFISELPDRYATEVNIALCLNHKRLL